MVVLQERDYNFFDFKKDKIMTKDMEKILDTMNEDLINEQIENLEEEAEKEEVVWAYENGNRLF